MQIGGQFRVPLVILISVGVFLAPATITAATAAPPIFVVPSEVGDLEQDAGLIRTALNRAVNALDTCIPGIVIHESDGRSNQIIRDYNVQFDSLYIFASLVSASRISPNGLGICWKGWRRGRPLCVVAISRRAPVELLRRGFTSEQRLRVYVKIWIHELLHAMGLDDNDLPDSIMNGQLDSNDNKSNWSPSDICDELASYEAEIVAKFRQLPGTQNWPDDDE